MTNLSILIRHCAEINKTTLLSYSVKLRFQIISHNTLKQIGILIMFDIA